MILALKWEELEKRIKKRERKVKVITWPDLYD